MDTASLTRQSIAQNRLLAALPEADCARLEPYLELVALPLGSAVYQSGGTQGYMYFPRTAIVSPLYGLDGGPSPERANLRPQPLVRHSPLITPPHTPPPPQ